MNRLTTNRSLLKKISKKIIPQAMAWAAVIALGATMAMAQDTGAPPQNNDTGSSAQAAPGQRTDGQIEMDVVQALDASQALKDDMITAATIQGEVTLSGTVSSDASKQLAASIAQHVNGVSKVNNNLTVGNPQDAQNAQAPPADADTQAMADNSQQPNTPPAQQNDQGMQGAPPQQDTQTPPPDAQGQQAPPPGYGNYPPQQGVNYPPPPNGGYPNDQQQSGDYPPPPNSGYPNYPQQGGNYPPNRPQYNGNGYPQQPQAPQYQAPQYQPATGPMTLLPGTMLQLRTSQPVDNKRASAGTPVQFTVIQDVTLNGMLAIPRGATVNGVVTDTKKAGELAGSPELALTLTSLEMGGQSYPLDTDQFRVKGPNKAGRTVGNAVGGALLGTIIGCAVGRGPGCAIGAGAGAAAGTAASAASPGPNVWIPAEALVTFHLKSPVTVNPVSQQEASRLAQGLFQGGPSLYRRGYPPYGYRAGPYGYGYPYPPVYYRPYYLVGGYYYWR